MSSNEPLKMLLKGIADTVANMQISRSPAAQIPTVHKAIVCSQSEFFRLACRKHTDSGGNFKEAQNGVVDLPSRKLNTNSAKPEDFKWDLDAEDPKCVKLMIHYFYHLDYLEVETAKVKQKKRLEENFDETHVLGEGLLIDHAKMYAMADKYGVPGLKDMALRKYQEAYEHTSAGFANSMIVICTSTIDNDMGLRNVILRILKNDIMNLMRKPKINQNVKDLPLLSHGLLRKQLGLDA
ncbi:hypothetical protein E4T44_05077 [Aureobasidium sp. EXF-8845]|nr:hypothetical protein E4T44_05077 [Aureobasidium sp. EXF-8845]KAI4851678.1 hypothetical protein E4T45_04983 [Aureobasidium sp. EXF-8846]